MPPSSPPAEGGETQDGRSKQTTGVDSTEMSVPASAGGAVEKTAKEFDKEFLGFLPLNEDLRASADNGEPLTYSKPDHKISKIFIGIAKEIKQSFL